MVLQARIEQLKQLKHYMIPCISEYRFKRNPQGTQVGK
jgi:hypothetical protein